MTASNAQLTPLHVSRWDSSLDAIAQDMDGNPINVHKLMANHPRLLSAWWNFRNHSVTGGDLGRRNAELVILRVAAHLRSWYEWASHVDRALACGVTLAQIERVKQPIDPQHWPAGEYQLLKSVDELIKTKNLAPASYAALRHHYDDNQIMDIIAIHGMYIILGCMLNVWQQELDQHIADRLPASVTRESFAADAAKLSNHTP